MGSWQQYVDCSVRMTNKYCSNGGARREELWLHVDGAYGGLAALAAPEKFQGLSSGDSMSLDAHKWLYQPLDCGCVLYRNWQVARETFSHSGDYVRVFNEGPAEKFVFLRSRWSCRGVSAR
jgi:aromatic-L-amino-acid/L-tryptophan decarboxylase